MANEDSFNKAMKEDVNKSERNRLLFVISVSCVMGVTVIPHDYSIATIANKYIFPSLVAGMSFGVMFMAAIDLWKDYLTNKTAAKAEEEAN